MGYQLSPGVNVSEYDLTLIVPGVATTDTAFVAPFLWGPVDDITLIDREDTLYRIFGPPASDRLVHNTGQAEQWMTAASFLAYGRTLHTVRVVGDNANNASRSGGALLIKNEEIYEANWWNNGRGGATGATALGPLVARYPGSYGNSISVEICGGANAFSNTVSGLLVDGVNTNYRNDPYNVYTQGQMSSNSLQVAEHVEFSSGPAGRYQVTDIGWSNVSTALNVAYNSAANAIITSDYVGTTIQQYDKIKIDNQGGAEYNVQSIVNAVSNIVLTATGTTDKVANASEIVLSSDALSTIDIGDMVVIDGTNPSTYFTVENITDAGTKLEITPEYEHDDAAANIIYRLRNASNVVIDTALTNASGAQTQTGAQGNAIYRLYNTLQISPGMISSFDGGESISRYWEYQDYFDGAPGTSQYAEDRSGSGDELHIIVTDAEGKWTGIAGSVLERYPFVSKASDAKDSEGNSIYYPEVIKQSSRYLWWIDHPSYGTNWGDAANGTTFVSRSNIMNYTLTGGVDDNTMGYDSDGGYDNTNIMRSARIAGYRLFEDPETTDISILIMGNADRVLIQDVIDNICEDRGDCVICFSPEENDTVGITDQATAAENVVNFKQSVNRSTSYGIMDSGHKQMYDQYNDVFRSVPLNGDIGGLLVRTDTSRDPWWSPAGEERGQIKNIVRLYFNPRKTYRDTLYRNNINPVVSFPGAGPELYGDKTLLTKPSAFDRINVRRLFIVLEKAIRKASQYMLFEFNDPFTRARFRNLVQPFLEDVKARRGIYDYKVVCDGTNNTPEVIDRNEFVGDIYIKPARSINFIQLNFIAARTGVNFSEISIRAGTTTPV